VSSATAADLDGMAYLKWNMRASSFRSLVDRDMKQNPDPDGTIPSVPVWALHREVKASQFGKPRSNAIRFMHTNTVYKEVYEG